MFIRKTAVLLTCITLGNTLFAQTRFFSFIDSMFRRPEISNCTLLKQQIQDAGYKITGVDSIDKSVARLMYMHMLMTCYYSVDGDTSGGFGIPYFWNYTNHNPRENIVLRKSGKPLRQLPAAAGSGGGTLATLDRTPLIFWGDFMTDEPQYSYEHISAFYSFGWCSEREMAFKAWLGVLGIPATIGINGDHVWTEVEVKGMPGNYIFIDNTFNRFEVRPLSQRTHPDPGNRYIGWYNQQGSDKNIQKRLAGMTISAKRAEELAKRIKTYFNSSADDY